MVSQLIALLKYFGIVFADGDYLNDWVTHLPTYIREDVMRVGEYLASLLGCLLLVVLLTGCGPKLVKTDVEGTTCVVATNNVSRGYVAISCDWSEHD